ncbi:hypothetical protein V1478_004355 [Vespula squamosa]|uniref:Uncharacterized protein n=1 Tax=Vespula squamosa TaxID=30214 RepID=A0ABD2BH68_VESSQ
MKIENVHTCLISTDFIFIFISSFLKDHPVNIRVSYVCSDIYKRVGIPNVESSEIEFGEFCE